MTKAESTPYPRATLDEVMALASDLLDLSPDSALAALTEAKVAGLTMAKGLLMGSDLPPGAVDVRTRDGLGDCLRRGEGSWEASSRRTGRPTVLAECNGHKD